MGKKKNSRERKRLYQSTCEVTQTPLPSERERKTKQKKKISETNIGKSRHKQVRKRGKKGGKHKTTKCGF